MIHGELPDPRFPGLIRLSDVEPEKLLWLWPRYIPLAKFTLLEGDPSTGKSTLTMDIAAAVSRGHAMPDGSHSDLEEPRTVMVWASEDGAGDTLQPRAEAAKGDLSRLVIWDEKIPTPDLGELGEIRALLTAWRPVLLILDPLVAFLPSGVNANSDAEIRRVLSPLAALAGELGVAILGIRHLRKAGGRALYAGGGSIGFTAAARSVLVAGRTGDGRRVLAQAKSNLGPLAPSLAYEIEPVDLPNGISASCIRWLGQVDVTADQLTAPPELGFATPALGDAEEFLRDLLGSEALPAKEVFAIAKEEGLSQRTVRRAKEKLQIKSIRDGFGSGSQVRWRLPEPPAEA